ncbi:MAG: hypothetical protein CBC48_13265 [bacterium TMED88]|nr:MAG: hypothetical protein CBC48_13265 [bacterium TMED88]
MIEILVFILSLFLLQHAYEPVQKQLEQVTPKFKDLQEHKKYYVVKNLLKATYLAILCLLTIILFGPYWLYDVWPNTLLNSLASMYVSNDVIGLYKIKDLKTSTRLHHYTTMIFLMISYSLDFQESKMAKLMFLYTFASALTFPVNAYLGLRHCFDEDELNDVCGVAYYTYAIVCFINWFLQFYYLEQILWPYYGLISFVVYDDIVLLSWLHKKHTKLNL